MDMSRQPEQRRYSVREVSDLSGLAEKTIWRRVASGKIPHTREDGRVWIAAEDVPAPRVPAGESIPAAHDGDLRGLVEQLRADVAALRREIAALRARREAERPARPSIAIPTPTPPESAYSAPQGQGEVFASREHAARWLCAGHGPAAANTVKSWREWGALPTHPTPAQVWAAALVAQRRVGGNWRSSWMLAACADPSCACHELIAAAAAAASQK
jgi:predicted DNA-binding transcriptional regulator AlpA